MAGSLPCSVALVLLRVAGCCGGVVDQAVSTPGGGGCWARWASGRAEPRRRLATAGSSSSLLSLPAEPVGGGTLVLLLICADAGRGGLAAAALRRLAATGGGLPACATAACRLAAATMSKGSESESVCVVGTSAVGLVLRRGLLVLPPPGCARGAAVPRI